MRKDHHYSKRIMPILAGLLMIVMLSTSVSGYCTDHKTVTEWQKITITPAVVTESFVVPEQRAVLYVVNVNMTSKGVQPKVTARCNSPGSANIAI